MPTAPTARNAPDGQPERRIASRYRLKRAIGYGGMGVVWEAEDELLKRLVAVKEIQLPPAGTATERDRMAQRVLREARAAAQLGHPGAVTLYDVIEEEGTTFIVMELVAARTVAELVRDDGPLEPAVAADIGRQVLAALEVAHRRGIIHRDVKPGNVMVLSDGRCKLADFGIAKLGNDPDLTQTGMVMGSPSYIAPEQATGQRISPATDLYALGALLYFAVEGEPPFESGSAIATLNAVVHAELRPMQRGGLLAPVIRKLLAKEPDERPSAEALRWMLDQVAELPRDAADPAGAAAAGADPTVPVSPVAPPSTHALPPPPRPSGPRQPAAEQAPAGQQPAAARQERAEAPAPVAEPETSPAAAQPPGRSAEGAPVMPAEQPSGPWRRHRRRWVAALAAFAALVVVTLSLDLILPEARGRIAGGPTTTAASQTAAPESTAPDSTAPESTAPESAAPESTATQTTQPPPTTAAGDGEDGERGRGTGEGPAAVPADWRTYTDEDAGYRVAHPPGWQIRPAGGRQVDLVDPEAGRYLRVAWSDQPKDPMEAWRGYEPAFAAQHGGYERIRLEPSEFKGMDAALWEYRYSDGGAQLHAVNLTFVDDAGELAYALNFQTREEDWDASQELFEQLKESFQPR